MSLKISEHVAVGRNDGTQKRRRQERAKLDLGDTSLVGCPRLGEAQNVGLSSGNSPVAGRERDPWQHPPSVT